MRFSHDYSQKAYKLHLRKFGVRKNVRVQKQEVPQVLQLISRVKNAKDSGVSKERVRLATGQVVDIERLEAYLRRRKLLADEDDPSSSDSDDHMSPELMFNAYAAANRLRFHRAHAVLIPPTVDAPDTIRLPEWIFSELRSHVSSKFSDGPAASNEEITKPSNPLVTQAHDTIGEAANLLAAGQLEDAIAWLKLAPRQMEILLTEQEREPPSLQLLIWRMGISLIASARMSGLEADLEQVARSLIRYLGYLSTKSKSLSPQIRNILSALSALSRIDGPWMFETASRGIIAMLDQHDLRRKFQAAVSALVRSVAGTV